LDLKKLILKKWKKLSDKRTSDKKNDNKNW